MTKKAFHIGLALSLAIHMMIAIGTFLLPEVPPKNEIITFEMIETPKQVDLNKVNVEKSAQVVEQDQRVNEEKPQDKFYMSQFDQTVKKQTVAQNHGAFQNSQASRGQQNNPRTAPQKQDVAEKKQQPVAKGETFKRDPLKNFIPSYNYGNNGQNSQANAQNSQTRDHLKDVDKGMETMLSTREFIYYSYYNRIRNQLSQYWEPLIKEKVENIFRQGRTIASEQDRITKLVVVLDKRGILVKVQVLNASGVTDLDDAAIEAFKKAAPFPNPPKGIEEADGTIKIRWDFVLEA